MNVRGRRTRAQLIQATLDVVADVGYARATTKAIAEAAGVAEGTIYRHFSDKRQLFYAAVLDRNTAVLEWITALPERAGGGTVRGNLLEALTQLGRLRTDLLPLELWLRSDPELSRDLAAAFADLSSAAAPPSPGLPGVGVPPGVASGVAAGHLPAGASGLPGPPQFIAKYLAVERDLGRIRADADPDDVAVLLLVILFGIAMSQLGDGVDEYLMAVAVDTVLNGIRPGSP